MQVGTLVLEQGGGVERARGRGAPAPSPQSAVLSSAGSALDFQDGRARQITEWLLLLLRFAITRDPEDERAALMVAEGIDSLGRQWGRAAPTFFRRSSDEVCKAIMALDDPGREAILKKYICRIKHPGLRHAFQAVVHFEERAQTPDRRSPPDLRAVEHLGGRHLEKRMQRFVDVDVAADVGPAGGPNSRPVLVSTISGRAQVDLLMPRLCRPAGIPLEFLCSEAHLYGAGRYPSLRLV